jgi:hypothetical protein
VLTYGSEALTVCKRDESIITVAEMKFMRRKARQASLVWVIKRVKREGSKELNTQPVVEFIEIYRANIKNMFCEYSSLESYSNSLLLSKKDEEYLGRHYKRYIETITGHWA